MADAKTLAANDKDTPKDYAKSVPFGKQKKVKAAAEPKVAEERYAIGVTDTVKRGFLLEFVNFTKKKGTVTGPMLVAEFNGRQFSNHKVDAARVQRYIRYSLNNGIFKVVK